MGILPNNYWDINILWQTGYFLKNRNLGVSFWLKSATSLAILSKSHRDFWGSIRGLLYRKPPYFVITNFQTATFDWGGGPGGIWADDNVIKNVTYKMSLNCS